MSEVQCAEHPLLIEARADMNLAAGMTALDTAVPKRDSSQWHDAGAELDERNDDPFLEAERAQKRGGAPTIFVHLDFSDDCRLMWCRYDGISIWFLVYVEPSHAICVTLCLVADISHQLEHVFAGSCWYLLHLTSLHHCFARSFPNHCFFCHIRPICRSR